jgi:hypothetical protein
MEKRIANSVDRTQDLQITLTEERLQSGALPTELNPLVMSFRGGVGRFEL